MNLRSFLTLGTLAAVLGAASLPASAQMNGAPLHVRGYRHWQPDWDHDRYDRQHVIVGTVSNFRPFRLQIARSNGTVQMVDLKQGTRIFPRGETPSVNERVAVSGYYSNGTFIADRVMLRD
jgi:hypothetical protein